MARPGSATIPSEVLQAVFADAKEAVLFVSTGGAGFDDVVQADDYTIFLWLGGESTWSGERDQELLLFFSR